MEDMEAESNQADKRPLLLLARMARYKFQRRKPTTECTGLRATSQRHNDSLMQCTDVSLDPLCSSLDSEATGTRASPLLRTPSSFLAITFSVVLLTNALLPPGGFAVVHAVDSAPHPENVQANSAQNHHQHRLFRRQALPSHSSSSSVLPPKLTIGVVMPLHSLPSPQQNVHFHHRHQPLSHSSPSLNGVTDEHAPVTTITNNNSTVSSTGTPFSSSHSFNLTSHLRTALRLANAELRAHRVPTELQIRLIEMATNPVTTSFSVCERLLSGQAPPSNNGNMMNGDAASSHVPIYAVITGSVASKANYDDRANEQPWPAATVQERSVVESAQLATASVSYTSGYLQIPVLSLARDSEFSDKNAHRLVLRILPAFSHQADVWVQVLKYFATTVHCRSAAAAAAAAAVGSQLLTTTSAPKSKKVTKSHVTRELPASSMQTAFSQPQSKTTNNNVSPSPPSLAKSKTAKLAEFLEMPSTPAVSSIKLLNETDEVPKQPARSRHYRSLSPSNFPFVDDSASRDSSSSSSSSFQRLRTYSSSPPSFAPAAAPYSYFYVDHDDDFYQTIATPFFSSYDDDFVGSVGGDEDETKAFIHNRRQRNSIRQRRSVSTTSDNPVANQNPLFTTTDDLSALPTADTADDEDTFEALSDDISGRHASHPYDLSSNAADDDDEEDDGQHSSVTSAQDYATLCSNQENQQQLDEDDDYVTTSSDTRTGPALAASTPATSGKARPGWTNVVVITSADADGRFLLSRLHSAAERNDIKIEDSIIYESGTQSVREQLYRVIASATSRVFLVHAPNLNDSAVIFHDADSLGLTGAHSVWLVSEQALASPYCPLGALGIRLVAHDNVGAQVRDAVRIVARALIDIVRPSLSPSSSASAASSAPAMSIFGLAPPPPTSCLSSSSSAVASSSTDEKILPSSKSSAVYQDAHNNQPLFQKNSPVTPQLRPDDESSSSVSTVQAADSRWSAGPLFFDYLVNQTLSNGDTGFIKFDDTGDRVFANYDILNVVEQQQQDNNARILGKRHGRRANIVGSFRYDTNGQKATEKSTSSNAAPRQSTAGGTGKMKLRMHVNDIVWPGGMHRQLPRGYVMPSHLIASTIVETPFVYAEPVASAEQCQAHRKRNSTSGWQYSVVYCQRGHGWTPADGDMIGEHNCCYGYCVDLLLHLSTALNFTFDLLLSPQAGASIQENITYRETQWTGIVGDLVTRRADIAVAPITITPERVRVIDFSKPFKYQGITIMIKKTETVSKLNSFLQPFHYELWLLVGVALHFVAFALYLLDRFSPFGRYRLSGHYHPRQQQQEPHQHSHQQPLLPQTSINSTSGSLKLAAHQFVQAQTSNAGSIAAAAAAAAAAAPTALASHDMVEEYEEDALNLSSAMWFAWGVLLNSGIGEGTPRSFGGRVLGMVWAGFAMIMVASYTANLAAFLVLDRSQTRLAGINDPHLRNPTENITFATVKDSAVHMYFKRQVELSAMLRKMEKWNFNNADDAIKAVKTEELKAFIYDSSRLEYEAARDCELITVGELFGRSGYGVALPKSSPWTEQVSLHVLGMHERGEMERLDKRWIETAFGQLEQCNLDEDAPATLGLSNMKGVFILIAVGILAGLSLIFVEISYKRHNRRRQREIELARRVIERWRKYVERKKKARSALFVSAQVIRARGVFIRHSQLGMRNSGGSAASITTTPATTGNAIVPRPLTSASTGNLIALRNSNANTVYYPSDAMMSGADGTANNNINATIADKLNDVRRNRALNSTPNSKPTATRTTDGASSSNQQQPLLTKGWTVDTA